MIQPTSLWSLFKTCPDSLWVGDICRALGGQAVTLDFGQQQMLAHLKQDSDWMDERIDAQKSRWRERQKSKREKDKMSRNVTQCHSNNGDNGDTPNVTSTNLLTPLLTPLLTTTTYKDVVVDNIATNDKLIYPEEDMQRMYAHQVNVPEDYIATFNARIREMGFQYINRNGATVNINRNNWKSVLRKFYQQHLKNQQTSPVLKQDDYKPEMEMA